MSMIALLCVVLVGLITNVDSFSHIYKTMYHHIQGNPNRGTVITSNKVIVLIAACSFHIFESTASLIQFNAEVINDELTIQCCQVYSIQW